MRRNGHISILILARAATAAIPCFGQAQSAVPLPVGVTAVWDPSKAYREASPSRERVCINGRWRWLNGLYLDQPEEWDDPYRFFRW